MKTCTAFVVFNEYKNFDWTRICVESYRNIFPDHQLVAVDHNHDPNERRYLSSQQNLVILDNPLHRKNWNTHGLGLDCAVKWAKLHDYEAIVFIEPDCIFTGPIWYNNLLNQLKSGKSLAATTRWQPTWSAGAYHPCGSAWLIKDIPGTFDICFPKESPSWVLEPPALTYWEPGCRNWYFMPPEKVGDIVPSDGCFHFCYSRNRSVASACRENEWAKVILEPVLKASYAKHPGRKMFL